MPDSETERREPREMIDDLAEAAMAIEWIDLMTVMPILLLFEELAGAADASPVGDKVRELCAWGKGFVDEVFESGGMLDVESKAAELNAAIAAFEALLLDGKDPAEVVLPGDAPAGAGQTRDDPELIDPQLLGEFLERLGGELEELEEHLIRWEKHRDARARGEAKGVVHTIKGEAGALGLCDLEHLTHQMEEVLLEERPADARMDALLAAVDWIHAYADYAAGGGGSQPAGLDDLLSRLVDDEAPAPEAAAATADAVGAGGDDLAPSDDQADGEDHAGLEFDRDPAELAEFLNEVKEHLEAADTHLLDLEAGNTDDDTLDALFRSFHTIKGLAGFFGANVMNRVAHETENLLDRARQGEVRIKGPAIDVVFDGVDLLRGQVAELTIFVEQGDKPTGQIDVSAFAARVQQVLGDKAADPEDDAELDPREMTSALLATGVVSQRQLTATISKRKLDKQDATAVAKALVEDGAASARDVAQAMRSAKVGQGVAVRESVKVDAERLDQLVDLIGELVIAQSMVAQAPELGEVQSVRLGARLAQLDKLTRELQELGTGMRMVPVRGTFQRMARLVRDLSRKLDKPVDFVMEGEDTELDKNVVDRIGDPLVHMVRNAIDHGLEATPAAREAAGKPAKGRVELRAYHQGGNIHIDIVDDGRGLDRQQILAKARERGLVDPAEEPADQEVWQLLFAPGFSTAAEVSEVSGRGVGMDVVKRTIEALRGKVDISTEPGAGTCFSIRLPLTLAVIDGMVVRVGEERYIVPTLSLITSLRPDPGQLTTCQHRGELLDWQGTLIPLHRLARLFGVADAETDPERALCVVVEDEDRRLALMVDELLGQQQVVIKSLGAGLRDLRGLAGGAIMPDGHVGLIVDVMGLARLAQDGQDPASAPPAAATAAAPAPSPTSAS